MKKKKVPLVELPKVPDHVKLDTKREILLYRQNMLFREVQHLSKLVHLDGRIDLSDQLIKKIRDCQNYIDGQMSAR